MDNINLNKTPHIKIFRECEKLEYEVHSIPTY